MIDAVSKFLVSIAICMLLFIFWAIYKEVQRISRKYRTEMWLRRHLRNSYPRRRHVLTLAGATGVLAALLTAATTFTPAVARTEQSLALPPPVQRTAFSDEERACLARTVYGEAANQPPEGKLAVAAVVVTRSLSPGWSFDLCDVVSQPRQFGGYRKQLRLVNFLDRRAYHEAEVAAYWAAENYGSLPESMRRAVFFHEGKPKKRWQGQPMIVKIGDHVFYGASS